MTKVEFANKYAEKYEISKGEALKLVESIFSTLAEVMGTGENVTIPKFGQFYVKERPARNGRNPKTGEMAVFPARKSPVFKVSQTLKDTVNH